MGMKLLLSIGSVPETSDHTGKDAEERRCELHSRVRYAMELIESGHESRREWEFLRRINNYLMRKESLNSAQEELLRMIQPTMEKYGSHTPYRVEQKAEYHSSTGNK